MSIHNQRSTKARDVTAAMLDAEYLEIISGEGEEGTREDYDGERTLSAIRNRLREERCGGDRWAILVVDGMRI